MTSLRVACSWGALALAFAGAAPAQTYYSIASGGAQAQIGDGLPLPLQPNRTPMFGGPIGTGTMFPPLLIAVNPDPAKLLIQQTGSAPARMVVPPGVFRREPASPKALGVANNNPKVFQVRTKLSFSLPAAVQGPIIFQKNGFRTGPVSFGGPAAGDRVFYSGSTNRFGGPAQIRIGVLSKVGVWGNPGAMLPCKHPTFGGANSSCIAVPVPAYPMTFAAIGGGQFNTMGTKVTMGVTVTTPGAPPAMSPGVVFASIPNTTGLIAKSAVAKKSGTVTNMATSVGFPWTTGMVQVSQPSALAVTEVFTITGMDSRTAMGAGTISLVAGGLSKRKATGANADRAWARFTLPEPGAALGAAAALAALTICHGVVRRRSR